MGREIRYIFKELSTKILDVEVTRELKFWLSSDFAHNRWHS
jgi:hypothetical protein